MTNRIKSIRDEIKKCHLDFRLITLQIMAAKQCGNDVSCALAFIGVQMTIIECYAVEDFWNWLKKNNLSFGIENISQRWNDWKSSLL